MTDHSHPDLEQRIASLEAFVGIQQPSRGLPVIHEAPRLQVQVHLPSPASGGDEAADALPADLAAAINAARDGEITDEHVGTMLHYLKVDSAQIASLRTELNGARQSYNAELAEMCEKRDRAEADRDALAKRLAEAEQEVSRWQRADKKLREFGVEVYHDHKQPDGKGNVVIVSPVVRLTAENNRLAAQVEGLTRERDEAQGLIHEAETNCGHALEERDRALADLANANACLETSKGEARRLFEENKTIKADLAAERACLELQRASNERARKRYDIAHPDAAGKWPDRTDMVLWLMDEVDAERAAREKAERERDAAQAERDAERESATNLAIDLESARNDFLTANKDFAEAIRQRNAAQAETERQKEINARASDAGRCIIAERDAAQAKLAKASVLLRDISQWGLAEPGDHSADELCELDRRLDALLAEIGGVA